MEVMNVRVRPVTKLTNKNARTLMNAKLTKVTDSFTAISKALSNVHEQMVSSDRVVSAVM